MESIRQIASNSSWVPVVTGLSLYGIGLAACPGDLSERIQRVYYWVKKSSVAQSAVIGLTSLMVFETTQALLEQRWADAASKFLNGSAWGAVVWWQKIS